MFCLTSLDSSTAFHTTTPSTTSPSVPPKQVVPSVIEIVPYQAVDVVCRMFQADLEINLWQESTPGSFIQRTADGVAITRQGNIFTITQARQNDKGTYYCQAANTKKILAAVLTFPGKMLTCQIKGVRANCFCASLLRTKFTCHVMYRARALSSKVNNNRANGHCFNFVSI